MGFFLRDKSTQILHYYEEEGIFVFALLWSDSTKQNRVQSPKMHCPWSNLEEGASGCGEATDIY